MTTANLIPQVAPAPATSRLRERLAALEVTVLDADPSGAISWAKPPAWFVKQMIQAPAFLRMIASRWDELVQLHDQGKDCLRTDACGPLYNGPTTTTCSLEAWPGLYLVPLGWGESSLNPDAEASNPEPAGFMLALVLSSPFLGSDQFRLVCDQRHLDRESTLTRLDPELIRTSRQVQQVTQTVTWLANDATELQRKQSDLEGMTEELSESYEELSLLYKLSTTMTLNQWAGEFLRQACSELRQVLGLRWLSVQLVEDDPRLEDLAGHRFVDGQPRMADEPLADLGKVLVERYGKAIGPQLIEDMSELTLAYRPERSGKLLVTPLQHEGKTFGVVYGAEKVNGSVLSSVDTNLVSTLGVSMTIFLENRAVYEDSRAMFLGTLHALTSAIDAKDSYTHGHSERVALLSRMLAEAVGLDEQTVERVYLAGLVHDVGKIGVPEAVLTKPGRLTEEEFDHIKRHPEIGGRILEDIRQMRDLLPGVLHHHERWDGRGYPHHLAGYDIPLFGRLIGLADAFDAMSSDRTYRAKMTRTQVLEEIERCRGTQFDTQMADVFVTLDFSAYDVLMDKHAGSTSPMRQPMSV